MGGGFGSKLGADVQVVICARARARRRRRPVKLMLDRKHEHLVTGNRPSAFAKVRAGVDAEGKFDRVGRRDAGARAVPAQGAGFRSPTRSTAAR